MSRLLQERYFGDSEAELKILCLAALLCSDAPEERAKFLWAVTPDASIVTLIIYLNELDKLI